MADDDDGFFLDLSKLTEEDLRRSALKPRLRRELADKTGIDEATLLRLYYKIFDENSDPIWLESRDKFFEHMKEVADDD